jgi:hypothetical protein
VRTSSAQIHPLQRKPELRLHLRSVRAVAVGDGRAGRQPAQAAQRLGGIGVQRPAAGLGADARRFFGLHVQLVHQALRDDRRVRPERLALQLALAIDDAIECLA